MGDSGNWNQAGPDEAWNDDMEASPVVGSYTSMPQTGRGSGTGDPFDGVTGSDITTDANITISTALGDVDGDGDLDLVSGQQMYWPQRLYLNNGTGVPFAGVSGTDISTDASETYAIALGDVNGDGHLDLVAGNGYSMSNRLYLNNGMGSHLPR
jgi:hypothetical protein